MSTDDRDITSGSTTTRPPRPRGRTSRSLILNSLSTYTRMAGTLIVGLIVTKYLVREDTLGVAGFGLFALLMSSVGLTSIVSATVRLSLVRELSDAYSSNDPDMMPTRFTAAVALSLGLASGLFVVMIAMTPLVLLVFQFPETMAEQVRWSWVVMTVHLAIAVITTPHLTLLDAMGRIPLRNWFYFLDRAASLVAAIIVFWAGFGDSTPLLGYVLANAVLTSALRVVGGIWAFFSCRAARIEPSRFSMNELRNLVHTGGHVFKAEIASNLYVRTNQVLFNIFLGPVINGLFAVVTLVHGWTQQISYGLCFGIEPLAAKFAQHKNADRDFIGPLILTITRIQAGVLFPVNATLVAMAQIFINVYLGNDIAKQRFAANYDIANMVVILLIGGAFFVVMQGAIRIMLGAGHVNEYSNKLLGAGVAQAVLALVTLVFVPGMARNAGLSDFQATNAAMYTVVAQMSAVYFVTYAIVIPRLVCRLYGLSRWSFYVGALGPGAVIGVLVGVFFIVYRLAVEDWTIWKLILPVVIAGAMTATLGWFFVLKANERSRILELLLPGGRRRAAAAENPL